MARLFSLVNAGAVDDPEYGHFEPGPDHGGFDMPDELSDRLHSFHHRKGRQLWETEEQRAERTHGLEMARRRDPASMLAAMEDNQALVRQLAELTAHLAAGQLGAVPAAAEPAVTALTAQVEALTAKLAEMEARSASPGHSEPEVSPTTEGGEPVPSKAARTPKPPAKTAKTDPAQSG